MDIKSSDYISNKILQGFENVEEIKNFSILWSVFECEKCSQNANINKFREIAKKFTTLNQESVDFLTFLRKRYEDNREAFISLDIKRSISEEKYLNTINDIILNRYDTYSDEEKIFSLLVILYRIRNNFFHWEKARYSFQWQSDLFEACNAFLISLIK
jgi:hypothetical protein